MHHAIILQYSGAYFLSKYKLDAEAMGSTLFRNRGGLVVTTERSEVVAKPAEVSIPRRSHWPPRLTFLEYSHE